MLNFRFIRRKEILIDMNIVKKIVRIINKHKKYKITKEPLIMHSYNGMRLYMEQDVVIERHNHES